MSVGYLEVSIGLEYVPVGASRLGYEGVEFGRAGGPRDAPVGLKFSATGGPPDTPKVLDTLSILLVHYQGMVLLAKNLKSFIWYG